MRKKVTPYLPADKEAYLKQVAGFCDFLVKLIRKPETVGFTHSYDVAWRPWLKLLKGTNKLKFSSLKDAFDAYYWILPPGEGSEEDHDPVPAANFEKNSIILAALRKELRTAMRKSKRAEEATFIACARILDWGKVYRGSLQWMLEAYDAGKLRSRLRAAVKILRGDSGANLHRFNGDLRFDSGLTKIYSLACDNSIMYDSRVGAALGLLVRFYLETLHLPPHEKGVPDDLSFVHGVEGRNPSTSTLRFPPEGKGGFRRARSNLRANWILGKVIKEVGPFWGIKKPAKQLRALEAALFMLGYAVNGSADP